jgi:hypothetical protein
MLQSSRTRSHSTLVLGILVLLPCLLHLPVLLGILSVDPLTFVGQVGEHVTFRHGTPWIDPNNGFKTQALGKLSADLWLSGQVPWWNPYNGVGLPLAAEVQPASLFLPFVLLYHFRIGGVWVDILLQVIAGLSTYALLRKIKLGQLAACTGAILFELNGTFAWHDSPISTPVAFLPLLLLAVEHLRIRIQERKPGGWIWIPPVLALSLYAGFPETAYIDGLFVGMWALLYVPELDARQTTIYLAKLSGGVLLGLLCSLPLLIPFAEMLSLSNIGQHTDSFAHAALPRTMLAHSLMPWLFGPIFSFSDQSSEIPVDWGNIGGYFTAVQVAFALLGLQLVPRRLTLALAIWMLLCLGKTFDIRPVSDLVNLIPMVKSSAFFRYDVPSWELAGAVLAAFAVDALRTNATLGRMRELITFLLVALAGLGALYLTRHHVVAMLHHSPTPGATKLALAWFLSSLMLGFIALRISPEKAFRVNAVVAILVFDAALAYAMPLSKSGVHPVKSAMPGIAYLQSHIGLQRVYGMGPLAPNYGAYFRIAQINHNYMPVPQAWTDYIHSHLDAYSDVESFTGTDVSPPSIRKSSVPEQLRTNLANYEGLGVRYVLTPSGFDPFVQSLNIQLDGSGQHEPMPLANDQPFVFGLQVPLPASNQAIDRVSVVVGDYNQKSNGDLTIGVCNAQSQCTRGVRALSESKDNMPFAVTLDHALQVDAHSPASASLTVTVTQSHSTYPVAIWMTSINQGDNRLAITIAGHPANMAPDLNIILAPSQKDPHAPRLIYVGQDMDIYELPDAKPYFETTGDACAVHPLSRESVNVNCTKPSHLFRREAFYPGWNASVDGAATPITLTDDIFQGVAVPAGDHQVTFQYRPTHFWLIVIGFWGGLITWLTLAGLPFLRDR